MERLSNQLGRWLQWLGVAALLALAVGLAARTRRGASRLTSRRIEARARVFHAFAAEGLDGGIETAAPSLRCEVSVFLVLEPGEIKDRVALWRRAMIAAGISPTRRCSYILCSECNAAVAQPPPFRIFRAVAYEPALAFSALEGSQRALVENGVWLNSATVPAPRTASQARRDLDMVLP